MSNSNIVTDDMKDDAIDAGFEDTQMGPIRFVGYLLKMAACGAGFTALVTVLLLWGASFIDVEPNIPLLPCAMLDAVGPNDYWHERVKKEGCSYADGAVMSHYEFIRHYGHYAVDLPLKRKVIR